LLFGPRSDQDFDIAIGVTSKEIRGAKPMNIGGTAQEGDDVELVGFGCHEADPEKDVGRSETQSHGSCNGILLTRMSLPTTPDQAPLPRDGDSGGAAFLA
jgi:hypothetical protein